MARLPQAFNVEQKKELGTAAYRDTGIADGKIPVYPIRFNTISGKPTTLLGYGITDAQPLDGDLLSIANADSFSIYYRSAIDTWAKVIIGNGLLFSGGVLQLARASGVSGQSPDTTIPSFSTLDLSSASPGQLIEVTGVTTINTITIPNGTQVRLRLVSGLTITKGSSLLTPGGENIVTAAGSWVDIIGGASSVVTVLAYQDASDYSRQTFDNIYMNPGANIGFPTVGVGNRFDIGRVIGGGGPFYGSYLRFVADSHPVFEASDGSVGARIDISLLTATRGFQFPDASGILALLSDITSSISDTAYDATSWNGVTTIAPSKNAVRDKFETLIIGTHVQAYDADLTTWAGITPGAGVGTFLATPSSANLRTAITDETGSGALVFGTSPTLDGTINLSGQVKLSGSITPPVLTADVNDYNPTGLATAATILLATDLGGEWKITGIAGGTVGRVVLFHNIGAGAYKFSLNDSASSSANRITGTGSGIIRVEADECVALQHDGSKWRVLGDPASRQDILDALANSYMPLAGVVDSSDAVAGNIGEYSGSLIDSASATTLTTATGKNVTSLTLAAGDWDVEGVVSFVTTSSTNTTFAGGISTTSATIPTDGSEVYSGVRFTTTSFNDSVTLPRKRISTAGVTVYLIAKSTFSAGTVKAFGSINARRVR